LVSTTSKERRRTLDGFATNFYRRIYTIVSSVHHVKNLTAVEKTWF